jgi:hypothetical protein
MEKSRTGRVRFQKPKQKVRVTRDQQKTGVVLRTTKAW